MKISDRWSGIGLVAISGIAFAIGPTAAKVAYNDGSNALTVLTLRGLIGAAVLALFVFLLRQRFVFQGAALKWTVLCSAFNTVMVYGLFAAVERIPIGIAILIFFAHPILVAAVVHFRGRERLAISRFFFAAVAFAGLALTLAPAFDRINVLGLSLAAMSSLGICGAILCAAEAQRNATTSSQVNFYVTVISTAALGAVLLVSGTCSFPATHIGWIGIGFAGIAIAIGLLAFFASFRFIGPVRATMLSNMEPVLSILFAALLLNEAFSRLQWVGACVMISAIILFESAELGRPTR